MKILRSKSLYLFSLLILFCSSGRLMANRDSLYQIRKRVADSLNSALSHHRGTVLMGSRINFLNALGVCDALDTLPVTIQYNADSTTFTITVQTRAQYQPQLEGENHPLVKNLNAYLSNVWAMQLQNVPGLPRKRLYPTGCTTDTNTQPYYIYTESQLGLSASRRDSLHHFIDSVSESDRLLNSEYSIMGTTVHGYDVVRLDDAATFATAQFSTYPAFMFSRRSDSVIKFIAPHIIFVGSSPRDYNARVFMMEPEFHAPASSCPNIGNNYYDNSFVNYNAKTVVTSYPFTIPCQVSGSRTHLTESDGFDFFDDGVSYSDVYMRFAVDRQGFLIARYQPSCSCGLGVRPGCTLVDSMRIFRLIDSVAAPEYCKETYCRTGKFYVDTMRGGLYYLDTGNIGCGGQFNPVPITCFGFCDDLPCLKIGLDSVIAASAHTYSDNWPYDTSKYAPGLDGENEFERGARGHWRLLTTQAYKSGIIHGAGLDNPSQRIYRNAGVFNRPLELFSWHCPEINDTVKWIRTDSVTQSSPNGEPLEEVDILKMPSAAKFGYKESVPIIVVKNSKYKTIDFESFEDGRRLQYGENIDLRGHSGHHSYMLSAQITSPTIVSARLDSGIARQGMLLKYWVKTTYHRIAVDDTIGYRKPVKVFGLGWATWVAQTGEWSLYEFELDSSIIPSADTVLKIRFQNRTSLDTILSGGDSNAVDTVWIDDVRLQPAESQAVCYVYDEATLRPIVTFDDQHFGLYYQYNAEGKLVRKRRETERGMRTVQEAQYHIPVIERNDTLIAAGLAPHYPSIASSGMPASFRSARLDQSSGPLSATPKVSLLQFTLTPDGEKISLFGSKPMTMEELRSMELPTIKSIGLPDIEKIRLIADLKSLNDTMNALRAPSDHELSKEEIKVKDAALAELKIRRAELLRRAGIDESQVETLLDEIKTLEQEVKETNK